MRHSCLSDTSWGKSRLNTRNNGGAIKARYVPNKAPRINGDVERQRQEHLSRLVSNCKISAKFPHSEPHLRPWGSDPVLYFQVVGVLDLFDCNIVNHRNDCDAREHARRNKCSHALSVESNDQSNPGCTSAAAAMEKSRSHGREKPICRASAHHTS